MPSNSTCPSSITTTRWQSAATSSVWWVDSITVRSAARSDTSSRKRRRCSGSRPGGGLVEHEQVGVAEQGLRERDASPHAARQGLDLAPAHGLETDRVEHPAHLVVAGMPVGHLLEDRHVVDELERRERPMEAGLLRHVAEAPPDREALVGHVRIPPEQPQAPVVGGEHRRHHAQQGRLARAVRTEQTGDAGRGVERHAAQRGRVSEPLVDVVDLDRRCAHVTIPSSKTVWRWASTAAETAIAARHATWASGRNAASRSWLADGGDAHDGDPPEGGRPTRPRTDATRCRARASRT